jgi:hypothetical protein
MIYDRGIQAAETRSDPRIVCSIIEQPYYKYGGKARAAFHYLVILRETGAFIRVVLN